MMLKIVTMKMIVVFHNDTFMITQDDNIDFVVTIENDHD